MKTAGITSARGIHSLSLFLQPFVVSVVLWFVTSLTACATTYNWTNTVSGNWSAVTNWSPNGVPGASDTAIISSSGTYTVTVNSAQSVGTLTMNALSGAQTLDILSAGTLTINNASTGNANAIFEVSGGTLTGAGSLALSGPLDWSAGTIKSMVQCNGGTFSGDDLLDGGQVINTGTMTWNSPTIFDGVGSVISNASSGIINATGSGSLTANNYGPPQFFYNAGQFNVSASGPALTIGDIFLNSGTVTLNSGQLYFQGASTNTGTINLNGGILDFTVAHSLVGGTLNFGINALNNYGSNVLAGASALAGTLASTFNGSYLPSVGNTYNIMTYGSSTGSFTKTNLSPLAVWSVNQNSAALNITVLKLVPQMSWTAPAAIVYGTALSSTQLDATAVWNGSAVPGTFTYSPLSGTVLSSGSNQTLSVTFTPTDTSTYTNVTTNVLITVLQAPLTVTASNLVKTYGQTLTFAGTEFSTSGLVNGDTATSATISSSGAAPTASVAGSPYTITITNAHGTAGLTNYIITYDTGKLTVNPAPLTITANNRVKTYGQTVAFAGTEFTPSGLQNGETVGSVTLASPGAAPTASVAGSPYNIMPGAATGGTFTPGNYSIVYDDGALTVNTASLTITADNTNKIFGQTITFSGHEFTASGLQNGETVGSVTLASAGTPSTAAVGSYNIVPSAPTGGTFSQGNYSDTPPNNGTLAVFGKPSLTLTLISHGTTNVVTFPTVIGENYQLMSTTNLQSGWINSGSSMPGTGASESVTNNVTSLPEFYLLQVQQ